ncbi:hypothetical protein INS49_009724 [Diaporthe citri]|uniref:uncharacterized protein n=1 Tax=Diaporthe citri TaxID=83186 RepID=UPI001C80A3BB|nr:uncharacterized protein INS49_009724 [Diaporthe citri]KAG6361497.1 hypothetical protein INS49_009724 [Diaporthe citri]
MHQHPRHPPRTASPASSPQTNPTRSNNPREGIGAQARASPESPRPGPSSSVGSGEFELKGPSPESIKKLDSIVQNLFLKAAVLVAQARIKTTPLGAGKTNKWFSLETDEIDEFRNDFRLWKNCSAFETPFPAMVIETYLDASRLSPSQCLVVVDDNGKRWDVLEALNSSETSDDSPTSRRRHTEVILERWRFELKPAPIEDVEDFGPTLPTIYKKCIIFFRALFTASRIIPSYKFSQQNMTRKPQPALEVKCRVLTGETGSGGHDALRQPLGDGRDVVTDYMLGDLEVPVGRFYASVAYRNDCHFRVDDAESLLSSRFMGVDENFFKPSIPQGREPSRRESSAELPSEVVRPLTSSGSLNADDDNISEFLKVLDSKKTLPSLEPGRKGESATKRTVAQLSKFQHMRDSNNALTESMASSVQLQRSSSSPEGTTAIDIPLPLSPRILQTNRRSSSVAQQHRAMAEDEEAELAFGGHRSISLGAERDPPTASTLFGMERGDSTDDATGLQPAATIRTTAAGGSPSLADERNPPGGLLAGNSASSPGRLRYTSTRGRPTPPQSSRGSFAGSTSGRYGAGRGDNDADEEPLVFDMQVSEMGRRSLEEGRGGGSVGSSSNDRITQASAGLLELGELRHRCT